jgi:carbon-monoxide dehydrogenase medium subunit
MKPAPFAYYRPRTLDEAVARLAEVAPDDGRVLAGGQSLVPMMAFRLARPPHLVDINGVQELDKLVVKDGRLVVGALVRHARFHDSTAAGPLGPLLADVVSNIAHYPIRTRGTFCGSLANADMASEWCLTAVVLGADLVLRSMAGERIVPAAAFFQGIMTTDLRPDEILVEARLPLLAAGSRHGFYEFNRRAGDFALAMSLVTFQLRDGIVHDARIGVGGVEAHPRRMVDAEKALNGKAPDDAAFRAAAEAAAAVVDPIEDHATDAVYRRDLTRVVVRRALERAAQSANGAGQGASVQ